MVTMMPPPCFPGMSSFASAPAIRPTINIQMKPMTCSFGGRARGFRPAPHVECIARAGRQDRQKEKMSAAPSTGSRPAATWIPPGAVCPIASTRPPEEALEGSSERPFVRDRHVNDAARGAAEIGQVAVQPATWDGLPHHRGSERSGVGGVGELVALLRQLEPAETGAIFAEQRDLLQRRDRAG